MRIHLLFFLLFCIFSFSLKGQEQLGSLDEIYGLNPELYNGKLYSDSYNAKVKGHQYLATEDFGNGKVQINSQLFTGKNLNYDVYKQKILLSFIATNNTHRIIEIPIQRLQSFTLLEKDFIVYEMPDNSLKIFQEIESGGFSIFIYWHKKLKLTNSSESAYEYEFSSSKKIIWVKMNEELISVTNNKSLRKLFTDEQAKKLKVWLKKEHIKINKATDTQFISLANYISQL